MSFIKLTDFKSTANLFSYYVFTSDSKWHSRKESESLNIGAYKSYTAQQKPTDWVDQVDLWDWKK